MENGKIKIKKKSDGSFRKELKIGRNKVSIPKEFVFSEEYTGECDIELRENNQPNKIIINGKEIPKSNVVMQKKEEKAQRKAERALAEEKRKEEGKKREKEQKMSTNHGNSEWTDSFLITKTCVPSDTRETGKDSCDNFSLKLNYFARHIQDSAQKKEFFFFRNDYNEKKNTGYKFKIRSLYRI